MWNIIVWTALFLGLAVLLCLYSQEWYAQKYCPLQEVNTTTPCITAHKDDDAAASHHFIMNRCSADEFWLVIGQEVLINFYNSDI